MSWIFFELKVTIMTDNVIKSHLLYEQTVTASLPSDRRFYGWKIAICFELKQTTQT